MYNRDLDEDVGGVENQMDTHMEREEDNCFLYGSIERVYAADNFWGVFCCVA